MSGTNSELRRALLARVAGIHELATQEVAAFHVRILVVVKSGADFSSVKAHIAKVLDSTGTLAVGYEIEQVADLPTLAAPNEDPRYRVASLATDQTVSGLREGLVRLVPTLGRLVFEEQPAFVRILVARSDGSASPAFIAECRRAIEAIRFLGLRYEVDALHASDRRNELVNAGFLMPRREERIDRITQEDDDQYADRLEKMVAGESPETLPLVDGLSGSKVFCTSSLRGPSPLTCFFPLYDHVYVQLPPGSQPHDDDYFKRNFDLPTSEFIEYVRTQKLIPVFKFSLGCYPDAVARRFIEDPSLPFIRPRELDYLAARYSWQQSAFVRALLGDRECSQAFQWALEHLDKRGGNEEGALVAQMLSVMLHAAESFEGMMWQRGHLAIPHFSPALVGTQFLLTQKRSPTADTLAIDAFSAASCIALAQAFGASLHTGLLCNEPVLSIMAQFFQAPPIIHEKESATRLGEVLRALDLDHADIPENEYVDIFDEAETKRLRQLVRETLETGPDPAKDVEIRERVQAFNSGVRRVARSAVESANMDVVGDIVSGAQAASGHQAVADLLLKLLGLKTAGRVVGMVADRVIEDTALGAQLDRLRGAINGVPAQSIRLYRIRSKLKRD